MREEGLKKDGATEAHGRTVKAASAAGRPRKMRPEVSPDMGMWRLLITSASRALESLEAS